MYHCVRVCGQPFSSRAGSSWGTPTFDCKETDRTPREGARSLPVSNKIARNEPRLVEDGTHAELSHAGGTYESPWDRQTGAFLEAE